MDLNQACTAILQQLTDLISQISENDFSKPIEALSQSTIGQHLRHTLEFFICLELGHKVGVINYDKRAHDKLIESDKYLALSTINRITQFIEETDSDKEIKLEVGYEVATENFITLNTTYSRELVYNIEHAVHHMALIKIGVKEAANYIKLPTNFGIAASTVRHKESVESKR